MLRLPIFEVTPPDQADLDAAFGAFVVFGKGSGHPSVTEFWRFVRLRSGEGAQPAAAVQGQRLRRDGHRAGRLIAGFYRAAVQLSENASAQVLNGCPSRSRGHGLPTACTPLRVSRAPSAGISTVHTP